MGSLGSIRSNSGIRAKATLGRVAYLQEAQAGLLGGQQIGDLMTVRIGVRLRGW